jgi:hypothetical protein
MGLSLVGLLACSGVVGPDAGSAGGTATGGGIATGGGTGTGGGTATGGGAAAGGGTASDGGTVTLAWFSDWRDAQGTTQAALYDSKWTGQLCNAQVLEVISSAGLDFPSSNALRIRYDVPNQCLMLEVRDRWPVPAVGEYLFVRLYFRNDIADGAVVGFPHPLHLGESAHPSAAYATWINFVTPTAGRSVLVLQPGREGTYPNRDWQFPLATRRTWRLEVRMHRLTATTGTTDVRISDAQGLVVAESQDFTNGETGPNRRVMSVVRPEYPVTDASYRLLHIGNNGPVRAAPQLGQIA